MLTPRIVFRQLLGRGGWGEVYRASIGAREMALKLLNPDHLNISDKTRFRREFEVLRSLNHPALIKVHDQGEYSGRLYYTMDLVEGMSLKDFVTRNPESLPDMLEQLLEVMDYIHSRGIVHRDIKPENILVQRDGRLRLLDFGLAREVSSGHTLTCQGHLLGTPAYMSPEQIRGDNLDHRSDLYSIGVLAYEAISGHPPFASEEVHTLLYQVLNEEPGLLPALQPSHVLQLVHWMLEKDPRDRPDSASTALKTLRGKPPGWTRSLQRLRVRANSWLPFVAGITVGWGLWHFF